MRRRTMLTKLLGFGVAAPAARASKPYPDMHAGGAVFRRAVDGCKDTPLRQRITGLTVPHHLLAADLISQAFRLASHTRPCRLVILTPDHFDRGCTAFSTTIRGFTTVFGPLPADRHAARALLAACPLVSESSLFSHEHGVQAVLPFAARVFGAVPVLAIACGIRTTPDDWRTLAAALEPILDENTFVVQSTDFSHYLDAPTAKERDAVSLRMLAARDSAAIPSLDQPGHLDSKAAMWLQMTLQRKCHRADPVVIDNRNAVQYGGPPDCPETTSYISMVWSPETIPASVLPGSAWFIGGDCHFGRHMAIKLADPAFASRVERRILGITGGRPLILNLEGVMLPGGAPRPRPGKWKIPMDADFTVSWLKRLGVKAVVLANNHSGDAGPAARAAMRQILDNAGIQSIGQGEVVEFPTFRLAAATDIDNTPSPRAGLITRDMVADWSAGASAKPLVVFFHAGREYDSRPTDRQRELATWSAAAGAGIVLGCHSHRASSDWENTSSALCFHSLGNLLFDQKDPANTGGLVEIRGLSQGTLAPRWHPIGNLYAGG